MEDTGVGEADGKTILKSSSRQDYNLMNSINHDPKLGTMDNGKEVMVGDDDEVIPTAIVIKNIPFAIKKEQLLEFIEKLGLPLPYAFNYHFDNGVFRGLAFANFQSTEETTKVIDSLNGEEIGGRKLRVEYKKMLPQVERERIEREKREKRGQLEEQHNMKLSSSNLSLHNLSRTSLNNLNVNSSISNGPTNSHSSSQLFSAFVNGNSSTAAQPSSSQSYLSAQNTSSSMYGQPTSTTERYYPPLPSSTMLPLPPQQLDFNDPDTLEIYSQFLLFKDREKIYYELVYPIGLSANHKRIINVLCSFLNLVASYDSSFIVIRRKVLDQNSLQSQMQQNAQSDQITAIHPLQPSSTGGSINHSQSYTSLLQAHAAATATNNNNLNTASTPTSTSSSFLNSPTLGNLGMAFGTSTSQSSTKMTNQSQLPLPLQQPSQSALQNVDSQTQQPYIRQQQTLSSSRIPSGYSSHNAQMKQVNSLLRNPGVSPQNAPSSMNTAPPRVPSSFYNNSALSNSATGLGNQFYEQQSYQQLIPQNTDGSVQSNFSSHSLYDDVVPQMGSNNAPIANGSITNNMLPDNLDEGLSRSLSGLDL